MSITLIFLIFTLLFLIIYSVYKRFCYFSNRSIPTPPISSIIYGHLPDLWSAKLYSEQLYKWSHQYGSLYGIYEGTRPTFVVSDLKFIEEVFITQFARFYSRGPFLPSDLLGKEYDNVLTTNVAQTWKRQRKILNPTFSAAKMKRIVPSVETCVNIFMERLSSIPDNTIIDIYQMYKRLTIDIICRCAFSIDTKVQYDINNENMYMQKAEEFFADDFDRSFIGKMHRVLSYTPLGFVCALMFRVQQFFKNKQSIPAHFWLLQHMHEFIQQRHVDINEKKTADDLLQLMIDAVGSDKDYLSPNELLSHVFILLLAGYETSSTALGYCAYRLAINQHIQDKLYAEINEHWSSDIDSYEVVMSKLTYMDLFVREVMRMHPPAIHTIHRHCMEDTYVAGYNIEKGSLVHVDVLSVHFNQKLWGPEPVDEFYPERHLIERHPLAYIPFGIGPRICLGMRLALLEMKLCLARLIHQYRIVPASNENYKLDLHESIVVAPEKVLIKLEKR